MERGTRVLALGRCFKVLFLRRCGGARAWPETAVLPGVTALAWTSLMVPAGVDVPHPDPRTKVREEERNSTNKEVDKWFVCFRTRVIIFASFSLL